MTLNVMAIAPSFTGPEGQEDMPYLLTPGPLTTSRSVKLSMLADWGSRDVEFRAILDDIRTRLLLMAHAADAYECVLMQGAGTFSIEAALAGFCPTGRKYKTLVIANGAYGHRAAKILEVLRRPHLLLTCDEEKTPEPERIRQVMHSEPDIKAVFLVHCETTTGIINPYREIASIARQAGAIVILDAMSSFGALDIDMPGDHVDVLVSSANKCLEGVPGFGFVLCRRDLLEETAGRAQSLSLDLYDQWQVMEKTRQFRFTPPTHALIAFHQALQEHERQGGVPARHARYQRNRDILVNGMRDLGFDTLLPDDVSGPVIQTFLSPVDPKFSFDRFYQSLRARGFAIYPGKLTRRNSFRIGTIGNLEEEVFTRFLTAVREVLDEMEVTSPTGLTPD